MKKRLLAPTQLSNYDTSGKFILECDSGYQMVMGRVREMLKRNPELHVDVMLPDEAQLHTQAEDVNLDMFNEFGDGNACPARLSFLHSKIIPNAIATRFDFDWTSVASQLNLGMQKINQAPKYDAVYVNDPMQLRNLKAAFQVVGGYQPKFYVHSHFIDNPSCPKFPKETSMWLGQCEAAIRADFNFWQCESSMNVFFDEMREFFAPDVVQYVKDKSGPWDDGYSRTEITLTPDEKNVRFDVNQLIEWKKEGKTIIFVPNRIGGRGVSSDYTNCGKFMFEVLPELRKRRQDYVVIAGNPSQKFKNSDLEQECGLNGYVNLVPDALTRDEFKLVAAHADIAVGLYDQDSYGGTAARECIELGCLPLWIDNYEYASIANDAGYSHLLAKKDFSDLVDALDNVITLKKFAPKEASEKLVTLQKVVRDRCSYESTTPTMMYVMDLM
jgi:hypothetical protein